MPENSRIELEKVISAAFAGVDLGDGMTLRDAEVTDSFDTVPLDDSDPESNVTDDWSKVPMRELDRDCIAHVDAEGFRYYIPALMFGVLSDYAPGSMRVIGTLHSLNPGQQHSDGWDHHMYQYSLLNDEQKKAIALYMSSLPDFLKLDREDLLAVTRGVDNYWHQFLSEPGRQQE